VLPEAVEVDQWLTSRSVGVTSDVFLWNLSATELEELASTIITVRLHPSCRRMLTESLDYVGDPRNYKVGSHPCHTAL
jgi:hypothetical protein